MRALLVVIQTLCQITNRPRFFLFFLNSHLGGHLQIELCFLCNADTRNTRNAYGLVNIPTVELQL